MSQETFSLHQATLNVFKKLPWEDQVTGAFTLRTVGSISSVCCRSHIFFHLSRLSKLNGALFNKTAYTGPIYM